MKNRKAFLVVTAAVAIAITFIVIRTQGREVPTSNDPPATTSATASTENEGTSTDGLTAEYETTSNAVTGFYDLPEDIMNEVYIWESKYPNMELGVGIYSLDGRSGYQYNQTKAFNSACTVKARYGMYVLTTCWKQHIAIWNTFLTYEERHYDEEGSGEISFTANYGDQYSIGELIYFLLQVSDNSAYSMLIEEFPLDGFYRENNGIGGENSGLKWGVATVVQRRNEWLAINEYVNSGTGYSKVLRNSITNTPYAYLLEGMEKSHTYMHKSGWCDSYSYPAAGDCAIIDDQYILIVLTQDYTTGSGHIDCIQGIGRAAEKYCNQRNGKMF